MQRTTPLRKKICEQLLGYSELTKMRPLGTIMAGQGRLVAASHQRL
jgi:hypothetical protein